MLSDVVRAATNRVGHAHVARHLHAVIGITHIPSSGPFVLVPNHSSFYDHFVVGTMMDALRTSTTWFPTKAEAFDRRASRAWHEVMHAVPLDRVRPSAETLRTFDAILAAGDVLCVYPEGTRGPGWPLLPFKDGAFTFAVRQGVPVIPMGIVGAQEVLPKGARRTRRAPVRIAFGAALPDDPAAPRRERMRSLRAAAETAIPGLMAQARDGDVTGLASANVAELNHRIDAALDERGRISSADLDRLELLADLLAPGTAQLDAFTVTRLRLQGLRASGAILPGKLVRGLVLGPRLRAARLAHPEDPMAHYLHARWHQGMPRALGGRTDQALPCFRAAVDVAPAGDTRYLMGVAEAACAAARPTEARQALERVIEHTPPGGRGAARRARAAQLLALLPTSTACLQPVPSRALPQGMTS